MIFAVAPLAGAWIEIFHAFLSPEEIVVAPLAGAWIEILLRDFKNAFGESLPSRERGLK